MTSATLVGLFLLLLVTTASSIQPPCVVRLGLVHQLTGSLSNNATFAAYVTAVAKINAGDWASGHRSAGFSLGANLHSCQFELLDRDDQSNLTLHEILVRELMPLVDFFLIGSPTTAFAMQTAALVSNASIISLACCLPNDQAYSVHNPYLFGISNSVTTAVQSLVHYQAISLGTSRLGVLYNAADQVSLDACLGVFQYAGLNNLQVVYNRSLAAGDDVVALFDEIVQSDLTFLFACVDLADSVEVANLVAPMQLDGQFFLTGPDNRLFQLLASTNVYTFSASQWNPGLPFSDNLFGNSAAFALALQKYASSSDVPSDYACTAAVSVEILLSAITQAAQQSTSTNSAALLAQIKNTTAKYIQNYTNVTLLGPIEFNGLHRNVGGIIYTTQLLPTQNASDTAVNLALIFPSDFATAIAIFPVPTRYCHIKLGLVSQETGSLANLAPLAGYKTAILKINAGDWGTSSRSTPAFSLGHGIQNCSYELLTWDDQSNLTLHLELTLQALNEVDFMLGGSSSVDFALLDQQAIAQTSLLGVLCCGTNKNLTSTTTNANQIFGIFNTAESAMNNFLLFLRQLYQVCDKNGCALPQTTIITSGDLPQLGVVYSSLEENNLEQCVTLLGTAQQLGISVAYVKQVVTGDGSITSTLGDELAAAKVNIMVACLETSDATNLAAVLQDTYFLAFYFTNGPGTGLFDDVVKSSLFTRVTSQWSPYMDFQDELLGDVAQFSLDLQTYAGYSIAPDSVAVACAVGIRLLHNALVNAFSSELGTNLANALSSLYTQVVTSLAESQTITLFGVVIFDEFHRNIGGTVYTSQVQPANDSTSLLVPVFPVNIEFVPIFPIPPLISESCVINLGVVYTSSQTNASLFGFQVAIDRINQGKWASGLYGPEVGGGFRLGQSIIGCTYNLVAYDDQSNNTLHGILLERLIPQVDFLFSVNRANSNADLDLVWANKTGILTIALQVPGVNTLNGFNDNIFGLSNSVVTATTELFRFLSLANPIPSIAVIYDLDSDGDVDACSNVAPYANKYGLTITFSQSISISSNDHDVVLSAFVNSVKNMDISFVFACLGDTDAANLTRMLAPLGLSGFFTLNGPGDATYDSTVPLEMYVFESLQWQSSLSFTDQLLGNSADFAIDLLNLGYETQPLSITCEAAVAVELLHLALMTVSPNTVSGSLAQVLVSLRSSMIAALQSLQLLTLFGSVRFNEDQRNVGGISYTSQVQPSTVDTLSPAQLQIVLPSSAASANPIYPAPTYTFCLNLLSVPTTLSYYGTGITNSSASDIVRQCKAWEDATRLITNTGGVAPSDNTTQIYVCETCIDLFVQSECYGLDAVKNLTLFPFFRVSSCGGVQDSTQDTCLTVIGNSSQTLVVACDYTPWNSAAGIFSLSFLCGCACVNAVFAMLVIRYRNAKAIKFAQFPLLLAFICGAGLVCALGLVFIGEPTDLSCQLRTWLFNLSVAICLSPLFLKSYRVWLIFDNPRLKPLIVTNVMLFKLVGVVMLCEVLWLSIWTGVSPTMRVCRPMSFPQLLTPIPSYSCANTMSFFAIIAALLIAGYVITCMVLGLLTINISTVFAEKEVMFASINIGMVGGIVAFLYFFTNLSPQATTSLVAVGLGWCSTFSVVVLVAPKIYLVVKKGENYTQTLAFQTSNQDSAEVIRKLNLNVALLGEELVTVKLENGKLRDRLKLSSPDASIDNGRVVLPTGDSTTINNISPGSFRARMSSSSAGGWRNQSGTFLPHSMGTIGGKRSRGGEESKAQLGDAGASSPGGAEKVAEKQVNLV